MEWEGREESQNVEDIRGIGGKGLAVGGGIGGLLLLVAALVLGVDPAKLGRMGGGGGGQPRQQRPFDPKEEELARFTKVIFRDTEVVWDDLFHKMGSDYRKPTLVLYTDQVDSGCGAADASVGPFYCPADEKVYIDLSFYNDMERQLNAPGDFARAYVIAHEVGHHVQRLLGYSRRVDEVRRTKNQTEINKASVRLELQADYLAGVWAHHGQKRFKFLQPGDIDEAIKAAYEIGDDTLQKKRKGFAVPHTFTHGTSKQRMRWFKEGFQSGDVKGARRLFEVPYEQL